MCVMSIHIHIRLDNLVTPNLDKLASFDFCYTNGTFKTTPELLPAYDSIYEK